MNKDFLLWQFIQERLTAQQQVILLLVTESQGSSPGRRGFKMAVGEHDLFLGSIGGGIMEVKLVELAKKMLSEKSTLPKIKKQVHSKNASRDQSGMICSGEQTVIYFHIQPEDHTEVQKIVDTLSKFERVRLRLSHINQNSIFKVLDVPSGVNQMHFIRHDENDFEWEENIGFKHQLYIVGGGHCALALSEIMSRFEFNIHIMDDRPELNTLFQNEFVQEKHIIDSYADTADIIPSGNDVFVVIMTQGYRSDLMVLQALSTKTFTYIGLLGSETKVAALKAEYLKSGFPESLLEVLHAPIGIKINSHTPEEIAISIAAELIHIKNLV